MFPALPRDFFNRDARVVAPELLGHYLLRQINGEWCGGVIVETEAYLSRDDPSMWLYQRENKRNRVLFHEPGHFFIYRVYRVHALLNVSCREVGIAEAVLVRAIEPQFGEGEMRKRRRVERSRDLTSGPSKLCSALGVDVEQSGVDACDANSELFYARNPNYEVDRASRTPLVITTRIGLSRGGDLPLRFYLSGSDFVSKKLPRLPKREVEVAVEVPNANGD